MTAARWQAVTEWPLIGVALVFLVTFSWAVIGDLHDTAAVAANAVLWACWAFFAVDYLVRLVLAERRAQWFVRHLPDLAVVALPMLRPLRLLRLVILLAAFQRLAGRTMRGRIVVYVVGSTVGLVYLCALAMLDVERGVRGSHIHDFGDALWCAFATITTVGYGDIVPVTLTGRCIAVVLMIGGVALLGTVTATLASWLVERMADQTRDAVEQVSTEEAQAEQRSADAAAQLAEQVRSLAAELAELRATLRASPAGRASGSFAPRPGESAEPPR